MLVRNFFFENSRKYTDFNFKHLKNIQIAGWRNTLKNTEVHVRLQLDILDKKNGKKSVS